MELDTDLSINNKKIVEEFYADQNQSSQSIKKTKKSSRKRLSKMISALNFFNFIPEEGNNSSNSNGSVDLGSCSGDDSGTEFPECGLQEDENDSNNESVVKITELFHTDEKVGNINSYCDQHKSEINLTESGSFVDDPPCFKDTSSLNNLRVTTTLTASNPTLVRVSSHHTMIPYLHHHEDHSLEAGGSMSERSLTAPGVMQLFEDLNTTEEYTAETPHYPSAASSVVNAGGAGRISQSRSSSACCTPIEDSNEEKEDNKDKEGDEMVEDALLAAVEEDDQSVSACGCETSANTKVSSLVEDDLATMPSPTTVNTTGARFRAFLPLVKGLSTGEEAAVDSVETICGEEEVPAKEFATLPHQMPISPGTTQSAKDFSTTGDISSSSASSLGVKESGAFVVDLVALSDYSPTSSITTSHTAFSTASQSPHIIDAQQHEQFLRYERQMIASQQQRQQQLRQGGGLAPLNRPLYFPRLASSSSRRHGSRFKKRHLIATIAVLLSAITAMLLVVLCRVFELRALAAEFDRRAIALLRGGIGVGSKRLSVSESGGRYSLLNITSVSPVSVTTSSHTDLLAAVTAVDELDVCLVGSGEAHEEEEEDKEESSVCGMNSPHPSPFYGNHSLVSRQERFVDLQQDILHFEVGKEVDKKGLFEAQMSEQEQSMAMVIEEEEGKELVEDISPPLRLTPPPLPLSHLAPPLELLPHKHQPPQSLPPISPPEIMPPVPLFPSRTADQKQQGVARTGPFAGMRMRVRGVVGALRGRKRWRRGR